MPALLPKHRLDFLEVGFADAPKGSLSRGGATSRPRFFKNPAGVLSLESTRFRFFVVEDHISALPSGDSAKKLSRFF